MSDIAIRVENLGKLYRVGQLISYNTLRESLTNAMLAPFRGIFSTSKKQKPTIGASSSSNETIWALKNVSFEVEQGSAVGIIGRNGAGKTTLLKILTRITTPTEGYAEIYGHVGSLLEVGTGFHAELTGRENIYFNGAVLGMKRTEIDRKFDDIVEFSGVKKFLDTPLKRYSSGMHVRLAFAVSAYLDPDILLVDEVLAVGDNEFQKRCLGKMDEVTKGGRTVLFVSHNMSAIKAFCHRTILLEQGEIVMDGPTEEVVKHYLGSGLHTQAESKWDNIKSAPGGDVVRLHVVRAKNNKGEVTSEFNIQESIYIEIEFWVLQDGFVLNDFFRFYDESGLFLFTSYNNQDSAWRNQKRSKGLYRGVCCIPGNFLTEGNFSVWAAVATLPGTLHALEIDAIAFHVHDPGSGGARGDYTSEWPGGVIRPILEWTTEYMSK